MADSAPDWLIRGGTVFDGTHSRTRKVEVCREKGIVARMDPSPAGRAGERVEDASCCIVAPGFIESHARLDGFAVYEDGRQSEARPGRWRTPG